MIIAGEFAISHIALAAIGIGIKKASVNKVWISV